MNIVFVGLSDVPFLKRAIDIRLLSFANLFSAIGHNVFIMNRCMTDNQHCDMKFSNKVKVFSVSQKTSKSRLLNLVYFICSIICEPVKIMFLNRKSKIDIIHIASGHYFDILLYSITSKLIGAKTVYHYCEYRSSLPHQSLYHRINGKLVNEYAPTLWDGAICISNFLVKKTIEINPKVTIIKVPPICDFDYFETVQPEKTDHSYILFCGAVNFKDTINLIINSYYTSKIKDKAKLRLILNGNPYLIQQIKDKYPEIAIYQKLEYPKLLSMYKGAIGLLIPLRNTIQDIARFPNKICEYAASKGVIVTTNFGEISYYFQDKYNALIADEFEIESYSITLDRLCDNINNLDIISNNAFSEGKKYFDLNSYKNEMNDFLLKLFQ